MSCMITARFLQKTVLVLLDNQWDHRPIGRYPGTVLYGWWWLRSPGNNQNNAANVNNDGSLNNNNVNNDNICVRPASPCLPEVRLCERRPVPWGEGIPLPFAGIPMQPWNTTGCMPSEKYADGGPDGG